ncbi:FAD-binding oxidoreductase [Pendulispora rubella]|uniref:D-amino-acid oxidase n=1 Tax=Pendulispora rubella TaxID=2741070 RepID=A0ABZ2KTA5_9BACT
MQTKFGRRQLLARAGAVMAIGALPGCGGSPVARRPAEIGFRPIRASVDRISQISVCTRPFRAKGPRLDVERIGQKTVVHNYGHGGSGWSLSWGSSAIAVDKAMSSGEREIAVVGCGALGLTSALLLQRAGAKVTIYAKELPPHVPSSFASGLWTPDSRICFEEHATAEFKQSWEQMARTSWGIHHKSLGLPGTPVEFIDSYFVSDDPGPRRRRVEADGRPAFAELQHELLSDLTPAGVDFPPGTHTLGPHHLRRKAQLMFNIHGYSQMLMQDFRSAGGRVEIAEFHTPNDFAKIREQTLIHATGYGARALFDDPSLTPVRGQVARTAPQPDIHYRLLYRGVSFVPRRDGLVFQVIGDDDYYGFADDTAQPDHAEAEHAVHTIAELFA